MCFSLTANSQMMMCMTFSLLCSFDHSNQRAESTCRGQSKANPVCWPHPRRSGETSSGGSFQRQDRSQSRGREEVAHRGTVLQSRTGTLAALSEPLGEIPSSIRLVRIHKHRSSISGTPLMAQSVCHSRQSAEERVVEACPLGQKFSLPCKKFR